jgi:hypothetical protein
MASTDKELIEAIQELEGGQPKPIRILLEGTNMVGTIQRRDEEVAYPIYVDEQTIDGELVITLTPEVS